MSKPAVLFDMDGLLLDTEKICLSCFVEARRAFLLPADPEVFLRCVGMRGAVPNQIIRESLGGKVEMADFDEEWDRRVDAALAHDIPLKLGARTLVEALERKGHPMAVATSTPTKMARAHLETAGLLDHFSHVIGGDMVSKYKPDPEVYHKAAKELGYVARDCIVFEDSDMGTRAAIASGARTVQIPDLIAPSEEVRGLGHLIAPDLLEGAVAVGLVSAEDLA